MFSIVLNVSQGSREEYLRRKVLHCAKAIFPADQTDALTMEDARLCAQLEPSDVPRVALADPADFPTLSPEQAFTIEVASRCALMEVAESSPLLESETLVHEYFTYLTDALDVFPPMTPVLLRQTSHASLLYVFDNVRLDGGDLHYTPCMMPDERLSKAQLLEASQRLTLLGTKSMAVKMLQSLLGKAAGAAGGKIGAIIFNLVVKELFGGDDNQAFVDAVKQVVRDEIDSAELDKINGYIQGTLLYMTNEYRIRKEHSDLNNIEDRKELLQSLEKYSKTFYTEVMGVLGQKRYAEKGLQSYMLGASIHLIITQEMALVDWKTFDPRASSYAATVQLNARHYREHITGTFEPMLKNRLEQVGWGYTPTMMCNRIGCFVSRKAWSWWDRDAKLSETFYNESHKKPPSAETLARQGYNRRHDEVRQETATNAGDPMHTAVPNLKTLERTPIPQ
ncbi:hypothetical protein ACKC9G_01330 [Pokkaliibacter sp. CJK22405]|uniref:hypothetical protein n=1 Tax=Pokkaliibacter sp. CJK22405 TaxID=3384615 RepID=UPI003984D89C